MELIKITQSDGNKAVSARELHTFLCATERFQNWFERQMQYGFTENVDFTGVKVLTAVNNGAKQELQDYALTIDCAKEISMLQKSDKGKEARRYFIEVEKAYQAQSPKAQIENITKKDLALWLVEAENEKERLKRIRQPVITQ